MKRPQRGKNGAVLVHRDPTAWLGRELYYGVAISMAWIVKWL